jgi:hypothetical protein
MYNSTLNYISVLAIEYTLPFFITQQTNNSVDDTLFWYNLGLGVGINAVRAGAAFFFNKPTPGISLFSLGVNFFHYTKKAIKTN